MISSNRRKGARSTHGLNIIPLSFMTFLILSVFLPPVAFSNYVDEVDVYVAVSNAQANDDEYLEDWAHVCLENVAWLRVEWGVSGSRTSGFEIKVYKGDEESDAIEENLIKETTATNSDREKVFSVDYFDEKPGGHAIVVTVKYTSNWDDMDWDTGIIFVTEMHLRETARPANRIAWKDPDLPGTVDNGDSLVVWHDADDDNDITFDVKKIYSSPTVYYKITERLDWNGGAVPHEGILYSFYNTHNFTVANDSVIYDFQVYTGPTGDNPDCWGNYWIFGVTDEDYEDSRDNFWGYLIILNDLADALYRRFRNGNWSGIDTDFSPTSTTGTTTLSDDRTTHNFGSSYSSVGITKINGVYYPRASATSVPIYYWNTSTDTSDFVRESGEFEAGINTFIDDISLADLVTEYNKSGSGNPRDVTFSFTEARPASFRFGPGWLDVEICLGGVTIMGDVSHYGSGSVTMSVTDSNDGSYNIAADPTVICKIEDVFDFNYFNPVLGGIAPIDGATLQCANGRSGIPAGVGDVALIEIDINGTVERSSSTKGP